ncbi:MAG: dihydrodipicolinate synthase family protein [Pirellulales bacterium]
MIDVKEPAQLAGLWAAIPTPWNDQGRLDVGVFDRNVERYAAVPVDGVYTTDSDGEFYAIELDEFRQLVAGFSKAMRPTSMAASIGVTWCNTKGIIDRIRVSLDHGISSVHVAFPFWMPLSAGDMDRFWDDLAEAAPDARWIHYNTSRGNRLLEGADYVRLYARHPDQFIGTKLSSMEMLGLADCINSTPQLSHLATEYATVPAMMLGGKGVCSYWVNTMPVWTRRLVDLCRARKWEAAMAMQRQLLVWEATYVKPLRQAGHLHGIIGKARGALTQFLDDSGVTRAPYYPVTEELQAQFKMDFEKYWTECCEPGDMPDSFSPKSL